MSTDLASPRILALVMPHEHALTPLRWEGTSVSDYAVETKCSEVYDGSISAIGVILCQRGREFKLNSSGQQGQSSLNLKCSTAFELLLELLRDIRMSC